MFNVAFLNTSMSLGWGRSPVSLLTWRVRLSSYYFYICTTFPRYPLFSFFVLLRVLYGVAILTSSTGCVRSSITPLFLISCFPLPRSASSGALVVVLMCSCVCRSRGWHSTVAFVSRNISSPQSILSSAPGPPSTHDVFALFRTSFPPIPPRSDSSLCSHTTPVKCVLSSCIGSPSSAWCSSP